MLLSITVYSSLALVLFMLAQHLNAREQQLMLADGKQVSIFSWEMALAVLAFAAVAGARRDTGFDYGMYMHQYMTYQHYAFFTRDFEPLFEAVTALFAGWRIHYFFYFFLWAALQVSCLIYACRHDKRLLPWLFLCLMLGPFFVYLMNTIREGLLACAFLSLLPLIAQRKFWLYAVVALFLVLLHKSALLMIPLFFWGLIEIRPTRKVTVAIYVGIALAIVMGTFPGWFSWMLRKAHELGLFDPRYYANLNATILGHYRPIGWGPLRITLLLVQLMVIWYYPELRKKFADDRILPILFTFFVTFCMVSYLLLRTHPLYMRPFDFLMITGLMIFAYLALLLYSERRWVMLSVLCLLQCSYIYMSIFKVVLLLTDDKQVIYQFFFA